MSYITHGKYMKDYFCKDCGKKVSTFLAKRCNSCSTKRKIKMKILTLDNMKGKHHSEETKEKLSKATRLSWINNEKFIKARHRPCSEETKKLISEKLKNRESKLSAKTQVKHHIYLKENSSKCLSHSKHTLLHMRAYEYLFQKFGEIGIDDYLKWFDKKYNLYE